MRYLFSFFSVADRNENLEQKTSYSSRVNTGERYDRGKYANCYFSVSYFSSSKLGRKKQNEKNYFSNLPGEI